MEFRQKKDREQARKLRRPEGEATLLGEAEQVAESMTQLWCAGQSYRQLDTALRLKRRVHRLRQEKKGRADKVALVSQKDSRRQKAKDQGWGFKWRTTLNLLQLRTEIAKARAERTEKVRVAAVAFRSVLVEIEVWKEEEWCRALAIADSGSGRTIFQLQDWEGAPAASRGALGKSSGSLVTADGSPLQGLTGSGTVQFRFAGTEPVHHVAAELTTASTTRILGVNFWEQKKATFDFAEQQITIRHGEGSGRTTQTAPFWARG